RLGHVVHKPVAVVIVTHIVVVQPRRISGLVRSPNMTTIPAGDDIHTVGIHHRHQQGNDVLPDSLRLFGFFGGYFIGQFRGHLPMGQLVGVHPAVDPDHRAAFFGKLFGFLLVDAGPSHGFTDLAPAV